MEDIKRLLLEEKAALLSAIKEKTEKNPEIKNSFLPYNVIGSENHPTPIFRAKKPLIFFVKACQFSMQK